MKRVLIIGGYGNFGRYIAKSLAGDENINLIIAGRNQEKAKKLADELNAESNVLDIHQDLKQNLLTIKPHIVIHTSGPFQTQGYHVAKACIEVGAHYIDLADAREFVAGITELNEQARQAGVLIISGASSVPCLTSALVDFYQSQFSSIESIDYGITTAQKTTRGLATTAAILSYTGKAFTTQINGKCQRVFGWQDLRAKRYPGLGWRLLGYCNVTDLELFPRKYPNIRSIRFYAGLELPFIHFTLWALSWLVRIRLIGNLQPLAGILLKLSFLFDRLGTDKSGFHITFAGKSLAGDNKKLTFYLIALSGDGPLIPCIPAIVLTRKLASGQLNDIGPKTSVSLLNRDEYLQALNGLDIRWFEE